MPESTKEKQDLRRLMDEMAQMDYKRMGNNIRQFRVLQRMTQEELAEKSLLSGAYISQIERADMYKGITYQSIMQISHALGVPVCVLVSKEPCQKYVECVAAASNEAVF